jgi:hypothetical protein
MGIAGHKRDLQNGGAAFAARSQLPQHQALLISFRSAQGSVRGSAKQQSRYRIDDSWQAEREKPRRHLQRGSSEVVIVDFEGPPDYFQVDRNKNAPLS